METLVEQRKERRMDLSWPVSVWLPEADRFFNGRSANVSKTGALITVPLSTPVREGSVVELNFPRTDALAEEKGQYARIKKGRVVRVDRRHTLDDANIGLGIAFE
ncbi:MAG TPA: PilZ domain-containing protein [Sedimentisphaerales bacterium]|nr:PilZ domain-containing protein [Sedimentisphaerales bacterium]HNU30492.1 PilZ domain-containing protein [Sedimentisphaerales bacterium]